MINNEIFLNKVKYYFKLESILLTVIYTIGHMIIAIACVMIITNATLELALKDAFIEPIINGIWFFILHSAWKKFSHSK